MSGLARETTNPSPRSRATPLWLFPEMEPTCKWCGEPLDPTKRKDQETCGKGCRQSYWRFAKYRTVGAAAETPASLAYADPPYPGKAHYYADHPDYGGEVDHRELLVALGSYDGWALSTSSAGLSIVIPMCAELGLDHRIASWHRGERKVKSLTPWIGWEPVVYSPARPVGPAGVSDALDHFYRPRTTDPGYVIGMKPAAFIFWLFELIGARIGDSLDDLFPGSGGVTRGWEIFQEGA